MVSWLCEPLLLQLSSEKVTAALYYHNFDVFAKVKSKKEEHRSPISTFPYWKSYSSENLEVDQDSLFWLKMFIILMTTLLDNVLALVFKANPKKT